MVLSRIAKALTARPQAETPPIFTSQMLILGAGASALSVVCFALDRQISLAMLHEPVGVIAFWNIATDAALVRWYLYPSILVLLAAFLIEWSSRQEIRAFWPSAATGVAAYLFSSVALAAIVTNFLKIVFGRARPLLMDDYGNFSFSLGRFGHDYSSFPSGHSTTIGAVTLVAAVLAPSQRVAILIAGFCIALSRIVVRAHYPSDVVAGFAIGALTAIAVGRWLASRNLFFRFDHAGQGWAGLLPRAAT
ncbi:phosphatase PAP2 family protein [Aureimonas fodinaquatilis]|uniref:phosphatase PAP2 family protein n=1 Tax=Aureimonas fodinaquatilis TaxID=2565783 RepID=UPI001AEE9757|nr:phosphatase PAP2 family protein [Aureimonas fodinaquatilis]